MVPIFPKHPLEKMEEQSKLASLFQSSSQVVLAAVCSPKARWTNSHQEQQPAKEARLKGQESLDNGL
jgi:hypothetical protein